MRKCNRVRVNAAQNLSPIIIESFSAGITTKVEGSFTPEKQKIIEGLKNKEKEKSKIAPSEFKLFDNRIDYKTEKMEFNGMN